MYKPVVRAFRLIDPQRRRRFWLIAVCAVVTSAMEAMSAVMLLVLMQLVLEPGAWPSIPIVGSLEPWLGRLPYTDVVTGFVVGFALFYGLRSAAFMGQTYAVARIAEHTAATLARRLVTGYLRMPYEQHLRRNSSELIRNAYDNVTQVKDAIFLPFGTLVAEVITSVALICVLVVASPLATAVVVALMGVAMLIVLSAIQPTLKRLGRQRNEGARGALQHLQQALGGVRDVKVLGREREFGEAFSRARMSMARPQYVRAALVYLPRVVIEAAFLGFVLVALVVAVRAPDGGRSVLATLSVFAYAGLRLQPSLQKIAAALNSIRFAEASVEDLAVDLQLLTGVTDVDRTPSDNAPLPFAEEIRFNHVSFAYAESGGSALRDVDLAIKAGQSIGICGPSGGGKSTFVDLLCGLLEPTTGSVTVDGRGVGQRVRAWQRNLGVVHQTSFLVDDTVEANIAFGVPPAAVDEARLQEVLDLTQLRSVVDRLPQGLQTSLGERGVRLSGGQRQRITLARALYRRPALLVLDEGTSALDDETEAVIVDNIARIGDRLTVVMVAHRLSTLRHCDQLLVFQGGGLVAQGTYDQIVGAGEGGGREVPASQS